MSAKLVTELPTGPWLYELKLDGYRCMAIKNGDRVQLRSRRDKDLLSDYPHVAAAIARLPAASCVIDGEVVALDPRGRPAFQLLQNRARVPRERLVYFAFDLLNLDGGDLTARPLDERKARLAQLLAGSGVQMSESLPGDPATIVAAVKGLGLEGIVAKRRDSLYEPGKRTGRWVKLKLNREQEFVVGGLKPEDRGFQSLLVGYYDKVGLRFAGRVRAGLTPHSRRQIVAALEPLATSQCPFVNLPTNRSGHWGEGLTAEDMALMKWVKPSLVVQVSFVEWPEQGLLRHSQFVGIRTDKQAKHVVRERPAP